MHTTKRLFLFIYTTKVLYIYWTTSELYEVSYGFSKGYRSVIAVTP